MQVNAYNRMIPENYSPAKLSAERFGRARRHSARNRHWQTSRQWPAAVVQRPEQEPAYLLPADASLVTIACRGTLPCS